MKTTIKTVATYGGHSIKQNKNVDVTFKFKYDTLPEYIKAVSMLNENVDITVKPVGSPALLLGSFMIKEIKVDNDGEGIIKFNTMQDFCETDNINKIVSPDLLKIMLQAEIETEEEEQ